MFSKNDVSEIEIKIMGMSCSGCERSLINSLKNVKGIIEIKPSFNQSNVFIQFNSSIISAQEIKTLINHETIFETPT